MLKTFFLKSIGNDKHKPADLVLSPGKTDDEIWKKDNFFFYLNLCLGSATDGNEKILILIFGMKKMILEGNFLKKSNFKGHTFQWKVAHSAIKVQRFWVFFLKQI